MASSQEFVEYVIDQIGLPVTFRKMFGEYALYLTKKVIGFVCDDTLFIKIFPENEALGADLERGPAYPESKDYFIVDESHLEQKEWLQDFITTTADAVPTKKKPKKPKKKITKVGPMGKEGIS